MCGIAGIVAHARDAPRPDSRELLSCCHAMAARGPDGSGTWTSSDGKVMLGHRRLSIIDLSDASAQPMSIATGDGNTLTIAFNGEIYNYRELRTELTARGHRFLTTGDTEVLLRLYADRGRAMLHQMQGMFAFAIHDARSGSVFAARDAFGIKPFYFADSAGTLRFASSVKALAGSGGVDTTVDMAGVAGFLLSGSIPEPRTYFRHVRALGAGEMLTVEPGRPVRVETWYRLSEVIATSGGASAVPSRDDIAGALRDSVARHMVADTPVGLFLSAGIDSTAILGLLKDAGFANVRTITAGFEEFRGDRHDEADLASSSAAFFGAAHATRRIDRAEFESDLPAFVAAMDQPTIDGLNTWFVAKAAKEAGLKVCLSGLGADELFGGYPSFHDVPRWSRQWRLLGGSGLRTPMAAAVNRIAESAAIPFHPKALALAAFGGSMAGAWFARRGLFMPWELADILGAETARRALEDLAFEQTISESVVPDPGTDYGRVLLMESSLYMRNQLLRDTDWASMAHSIEVRVPFVDRALFEALAPGLSRGNRPGKKVLTEIAASGFPPELADRPKTGFTLPLDRWTAPMLADLSRRYGAKRTRGHWSRRWALAVLDSFQGHSAKPDADGVGAARFLVH